MRVRVLSLALLIAACGDSTGPLPDMPTYALHEWGTAGQPPSAGGGMFRDIVLADTLRFPDETATIAHSYVLLTKQGIVRRSAIHQRRNPIAIDFHCHESVGACTDIFAPSNGEIRGDSLIFPANAVSVRRVYVRVRLTPPVALTNRARRD